MIIDHILEGKRPGEVAKEKEEAKRKEEKRKEALKAQLKPVQEDARSEAGLSQDSRVSKPIEDLVGAKSQDPRKKLASKQLETVKE